VKYDTAEAFRAALDQRIRNEATTTVLPVMRLRKRVAFERFLARLAVAEPGSWVLKEGAITRSAAGIALEASSYFAILKCSVLVVECSPEAVALTRSV